MARAPGADRELPEDPAYRRARLYFLAAGLDHLMPHLKEVERLAADLGLGGEQRGLQDLQRLREQVTEAIFRCP
jgi:hypothetical protein